MAIVRYSPTAVIEYAGLSTDTKPSGGNAAMPAPKGGDRFIETDTGYVYIYTNGAWSKLTGAIFVAGG